MHDSHDTEALKSRLTARKAAHQRLDCNELVKIWDDAVREISTLPEFVDMDVAATVVQTVAYLRDRLKDLSARNACQQINRAEMEESLQRS